VKLQTLKSSLPTLRTSIAAPQQVERLRGRAAVKRRASWLERHPLCVECEKAGRVTAATVPDHIVPLWKGGPDTEANLQSLCREHHDEKSAQEALERSRGGRGAETSPRS
jgi:5-methylcytosine-specific restriction protein A